MKVLADASLPKLDVFFQSPFTLTTYDSEASLQAALPQHDVLVCRSTLKVTPTLLKHAKLACVATASSGTDHIDADYLQSQNIRLFDAKGSNAEAVTDYVQASLAYLKQQDLIPGSKVGVIGAGEVGSRVITRLQTLGFEVIAYDPLKLDFTSCSFDKLKACQVLCIHANLHDTKPHPSRNLIDSAFLESLKPNTVIINAARGGIVNEAALLKLSKKIIYCTDVYMNEPYIHPGIIDYATLCTPHIAGHSIEAKQNAVRDLSVQLATHFNYPLAHFIPYAPRLVRSTKPPVDLYNPLSETLKLKKATNKQAAFLKLRRQHYRHHFSKMINTS